MTSFEESGGRCTRAMARRGVIRRWWGCLYYIRKLEKHLSGDMNTQNALWIVVSIVNRLAYLGQLTMLDLARSCIL